MQGYDIPPAVLTPEVDADRERWVYTAKSWDILYGCWERHLEARAYTMLGHVRREAWGLLDLSANPKRAIWDALAVLYDVRPSVLYTDPAGARPESDGDALLAMVARIGLWERMRRLQRDVLGLREMFVRIHPSVDGTVAYEMVPPHRLVIRGHEDDPDLPVFVRHARPYVVDGKPTWAWDELDISDPTNPLYRVLTDGGEDISVSQLGGAFTGDAYPFRDQADNPIIPGVLYHAEATGKLWDTYQTRELVEGTLTTALYYSLLSHGMFESSWNQRYTVGLRALGADSVDEDQDKNGRRALITDPSTVVEFEVDDAGAGGMAAQWNAVVDLDQMMSTIGKFERRLAVFAGINAADQVRMDGDPRSGYAISVSREAQRHAQARYIPQFRRGDEELLGKTAMVVNSATRGTPSATNHPEAGYEPSYHGVPLSLAERKMQREELLALVAEGLLDKITAYQALNPGTSEAQAIEQLAKIARINGLKQDEGE